MLTSLVESVCSNWRLLVGLFLAQGILGVCLFEWGWKKTERVRVVNESMMDEFPSFRRLDVHLWSRSKFYPGCFLILIPRVCWIFFCFFSFNFLCKLLFLGQNIDVPLSGWRRTVQKRLIWIICPLFALGFGYYIDHKSHTEESVDYSKYLGPEWRKNKFKGKRVSTLISNHQTFLEVLVWSGSLTPLAYTPAAFVRKLPIGSFVCSSV